MAETKTAKKNLVVTAPLVRVEDETGENRYLYAGSPLDGIKQSEVERLIDLDMVGDGADVIPGAAVVYDPA